MHSFYITADALNGRWQKKFFKRHLEWDGPGSWFGCLLTFHLVAIGSAFFRAPRVTGAIWLLSHLFSGLGASMGLFWTMVETTGARALAIGLIGCALVELVERLQGAAWPGLWRSRILRGPRWMRWSAWSAAAILLIFGVTLLLTHSDTSGSPFLYAVF